QRRRVVPALRASARSTNRRVVRQAPGLSTERDASYFSPWLSARSGRNARIVIDFIQGRRAVARPYNHLGSSETCARRSSGRPSRFPSLPALPALAITVIRRPLD